LGIQSTTQDSSNNCPFFFQDLLLDSTTSFYNTSKFEKSSDEDIEKLLKKMENLLSPHDHSVFGKCKTKQSTLILIILILGGSAHVLYDN
jgi:hypothetical protein